MASWVGIGACRHPLTVQGGVTSLSSPSYPSPVACRLPSSSSCFLPLPVIVLCSPLPAVEIVLPPAIHPTSSCSWGWGQVVCRPSPWVIVMGPWHSSLASSSLLGAFRPVSEALAVTWRVMGCLEHVPGKYPPPGVSQCPPAPS